jgi:hypothetical protein
VAKTFADHYNTGRELLLHLPDLLKKEGLGRERLLSIGKDLVDVAGFGSCLDVLSALSQ